MRKFLICSLPFTLALIFGFGGCKKFPPNQGGFVKVTVSNFKFGESWSGGVEETADTFSPYVGTIYYSFDYNSNSFGLIKIKHLWYCGSNNFLTTVGYPRNTSGGIYPPDGEFSGELRNDSQFPSGLYELRIKFFTVSDTIQAEISGDNSFFIGSGPPTEKNSPRRRK